MKRLLLATLLLLAAPAAWAQQAQVTTQQSATKLDVATAVQASTPAINAQSTLTIPAVAGQFVYLTNWNGGACSDNTAATSIQGNWTTTNMNGLAAQTSVAGTATPLGSLCDRFSYVYATALKSAQSGVAVTFVSPAANTHTSFPQVVTYYYAP